MTTTPGSAAYAAALGGAASASVLLAAGLLLRARGFQFTKASMNESSRVLAEIQSLSASLASSESRLASTISAQQTSFASTLSLSSKQQTFEMVTTLADLKSRLDKVNDAKATMDNLTDHVSDLKSVLAGPRTRGVFGEQRLEEIVTDCLPPSAYSFQKTLSHPGGGTVRPDCLLTLPPPIGNLCVDAKFPLTAFEELVSISAADGGTLRAAQADARKKLKTHLTKHIADVSTKYVIPPLTSPSGALLFLPSEAVFMEIVSNHPEIMRVAHSKNVWICSPTTLMAVLTTMRGVVKEHTMQARAGLVFDEVEVILKDVDNLLKRSGQCERHFDKAKESLRLMEVSAEKVRRRGLKVRSLQSGMQDEEVGEARRENGGDEELAEHSGSR